MSDALYRKYRVLWLQPIADGLFVGNGRRHCCDDMGLAVTFDCDQHADPFECPDYLIAYNAITAEYGMAIHDGGACVVTIAHCPFCGAKLPDSKADRWFEEIEALGFTNPLDANIPQAYKSDAWWRADLKQKD